MDIEIGDKVRFLNSVGGGTVAKIIDKQLVLVSDEDGFEIPCLLKELVVVNNTRDTTNFPLTTREASKVPQPEPTHATPAAPAKAQAPIQATDAARSLEVDKQGQDYELWLGFLTPRNEQTSLYILNDSSYKVFYSIGLYTRTGSVRPLNHGLLEGDSKTLVRTMYLSELRDTQTLRVEVMLLKNIDYQPADLLAVDIELNPIKFFKQGAFKENDFFDEDALLYKVYSSLDAQQEVEKEKLKAVSAEQIKEAMMQKQSKDSVAPAEPRKEGPPVVEVDLHAEILLSNPSAYNAGEILELQMSHFVAVLENALKTKQKGRLVFIHGIGSGKLKQDMRRCLERDYKQLHFQDASYKEYGYGATLVFL